MHAHALFALPPGKAEGRFTVLFLHGAKFSAENWRELKTLNLVAAMGLKAVALDLPGHGKTPSESEGPTFLADVIKSMKIERLVGLLLVVVTLGFNLFVFFFLTSQTGDCFTFHVGSIFFTIYDDP